jgi:hypothetical protein
MPRRKALDVGPLFELIANEVARILSNDLRDKWELIEQRLNRIEVAVKNRSAAGTTVSTQSREQKSCAFDGCTNPVRAKGLCGAHYQQLRYRLARESEGHLVRTRKGLPLLDQESPVEPERPKVQVIIRKKSLETAAPHLEVFPPSPTTAANDTAPLSSTDNGRESHVSDRLAPPAVSDRAIHPGLRPIV